MSVLGEMAAVLLGRSAYQAPPRTGEPDLDSAQVERMRRNMGGQIQPPVYTQTRWYMADVESAEHQADSGMLDTAARLMRSAHTDGTLVGIMSTRTDGLVRLPKRFRGDKDVIQALEMGGDDARCVFDEMFPPTELALLARDGVELGVGLAELVPVDNRDYPVMVRLDPEFLVYRWVENRWYYRSIAGMLPITPGDGRWILHSPGGRMCPWTNGLWKALARAYIRKTHAQLHKDNWEGKLANPARVAVSPQGAGEEQKQSWLRQVMSWGVNTVFGMPLGFDVKLIESNGRGWECFTKTIELCNDEYQIAVAGQEVTKDGGSGFSNADIHKSIRADLIKATAEGLAYTIVTQGIPQFIASRWGIDAVTTKSCVFSWDVTPPKDLNSEANSILTAANAIAQLTSALAPYQTELDIAATVSRFGIPVANDVDGDGTADDSDLPDNVIPITAAGGGARGANGVPVTPSGNAQDAALSGPQIASLVEIVTAVAAGTIPRDAALGIIKRSFLVDDAGAKELLGSAGAGFMAKPAELPAAPPPAKPDAPDAPTTDKPAAEVAA